jgi:hypothetical protein
MTGWPNIYALILAGPISYKLDLWRHTKTKLYRTHGNPEVTVACSDTNEKYYMHLYLLFLVT